MICVDAVADEEEILAEKAKTLINTAKEVDLEISKEKAKYVYDYE